MARAAPAQWTWTVAATHHRQEERAAHHIEKQGFSYYLPRFLNDNAQSRILFEGYILVRVNVRGLWQSLCNTRGISRLIMHELAPVPLRDEYVTALRAREDARGFVVLHPRPKPGDEVLVYGGVRGVVQGDTADDRIRVLFSLLGRSVEGAFTAQQVQPA
jgi:transcriptional antiterminator RfaH